MSKLEDFYKGKTVLVTGHTGFKGSWLAVWLTQLGAHVVGYSLEPPSSPSNFEACNLKERFESIIGDIRDQEKLREVFSKFNPDIVFHLAAQAIVRESFNDPIETFSVNVMGTINVLEASRLTKSVQAVISITSDKCYLNKEWKRGYSESDELGGYDPYSSSKACAELAIACYSDSRFQKTAINSRTVHIASVRAGNVIGGGDWAVNRIIPDIVRSIVSKKDIVIRSPNATRPWQHVMEPLSGYLWLGINVFREPEKYASAWNFGPDELEIKTVKNMVDNILNLWKPKHTRLIIDEDYSGAESKLLSLDCAKARDELKWRNTWSVDEALDAIVHWYKNYYSSTGVSSYEMVQKQIGQYSESARLRGLPWAQ
jgi:CDP-glucose 4,6-dehydratase